MSPRPAPLDIDRPVVTLHLPLEMGMVAEIMEVVARAYPGARVSSGRATTTVALAGDPVEYSTAEGKATVLMARADW